jgi:hypothetical protein
LITAQADPHEKTFDNIEDDLKPVDDAPLPDNIIRAADADDDDCDCDSSDDDSSDDDGSDDAESDCDDASNIVVRGRISGEALR